MSGRVRQIGWSVVSAVALVDGVRCTIRRNRTAVRWSCDVHGTGSDPHCNHLRELADATPDPEKENHSL